MKYEEKIVDLFSVDDSYYLAHCISADFGMGAGIAVQFNNRFGMKRKLQVKYPDFLKTFDYQTTFCGKSASCILEDKVFNLVTKRNYWNKPTYSSLQAALCSMKDVCISKKINKVAMPLIGCGLDKLEWEKVSQIIKNIFADTDIEILVCKQK